MKIQDNTCTFREEPWVILSKRILGEMKVFPTKLKCCVDYDKRRANDLGSALFWWILGFDLQVYFPFADAGLCLDPLSVFFICRCPWVVWKSYWVQRERLFDWIGFLFGICWCFNVGVRYEITWWQRCIWTMSSRRCIVHVSDLQWLYHRLDVTKGLSTR